MDEVNGGTVVDNREKAYGVIRFYTDKIVSSGLDPFQIARKLFAESILDHNTYSSIIDRHNGQNSKERLQFLMESVSNSVSTDVEVFYSFVKVLKSVDSIVSRSIADNLVTALHNEDDSENKSRYRVNVIRGGNVYNNPNINVNVNVNSSAAEGDQTDIGDYQGKEYTPKKRKDQSPEPCIDDRQPKSGKSSNGSNLDQCWKYFKNLFTLFCLVLLIVFVLWILGIIDWNCVFILLPTLGIAIVIYLRCGGDTDFIKRLLAFIPFAIIMKKFGGLGYFENKSRHRVNVITGGNVYNSPNINVNVNVNRSATKIDQTDTDKVYSTKKRKDQSSELCIDASRLISEKSSIGSIKRISNFIVQPKVVCALFVLIIVVMIILLLHYYYDNPEVTTPCHQIKSHNEVYLVLKDKISSPKIFSACLHLSRVEADIAHKDNILINEVLIDLLKSWYEYHVEDPCWEHIVNALKCIGENHLAKEIHDRYC